LFIPATPIKSMLLRKKILAGSLVAYGTGVVLWVAQGFTQALITEHIPCWFVDSQFCLRNLVGFFWRIIRGNWCVVSTPSQLGGASCDGSSCRDNYRGGLCFYCGRFKQSHNQSHFLGSMECATSCYRNVLAQTCQMRKMSACSLPRQLGVSVGEAMSKALTGVLLNSLYSKQTSRKCSLKPRKLSYPISGFSWE